MKIVITIDGADSEFSSYEDAIEALRMCARFHKPTPQLEPVDDDDDEEVTTGFADEGHEVGNRKRGEGQILDNLVPLKPTKKKVKGKQDKFTRKQERFYRELPELYQKLLVVLAQEETGMSEQILRLAFPTGPISRMMTWLNKKAREKLEYEVVKEMGYNQNQIRRYQLDEDLRLTVRQEPLAAAIREFLDDFVERNGLRKQMGEVEVE